jgi:hypothetical protein
MSNVSVKEEKKSIVYNTCFELPLPLFLQSDMIVTPENITLDNPIALTVARTFYLYLFYLNFYLKLPLHPHCLLETRDILHILKKVLVNVLRQSVMTRN